MGWLFCHFIVFAFFSGCLANCRGFSFIVGRVGRGRVFFYSYFIRLSWINTMLSDNFSVAARHVETVPVTHPSINTGSALLYFRYGHYTLQHQVITHAVTHPSINTGSVLIYFRYGHYTLHHQCRWLAKTTV